MRSTRFFFIVALTVLGWSSAAKAQNYQVLYNFGPGTSMDGNTPLGSLIQSGSDLYGFTYLGGLADDGTVFQFNTLTNTETVLSRLLDIPTFLIVGTPLQSGSVLYGMTNGYGDGAIFQYNLTTNADTLLHSFAGGPTDGATPWGSLIQSGGILYGTTSIGGAITSSTNPRTGPLHNYGTIFQYDIATNTETLLHSFGAAGDGTVPNGTLLQVGAKLYGTTSAGGANGGGALFDYDTASNTESVLYSFASTTNHSNGYDGRLVQSGSILYGATATGGAFGEGMIFDYDLTTNTENTLYSFGENPNDGGTNGSLILSGSTLYGMGGNIFAFDLTTNTETILHTFAGPPGDGSNPSSALLLSGSTLYGMTSGGGTSGSFSEDGGVIFSLTVPEPASASLFALSTLALFARNRRRI